MEKIDLQGRRFGRFVVEGEVGGSPIRWRCRCDCGEVRDVIGSSLRRGGSLSCGCLRSEMQQERTDIEGRRFGRLTVGARVGEGRWWCFCECGAEKVISSAMLHAGKAKSCGCLRREAGVARGKASTRHGHASGGTATTEYRIWTGMIQRTTNPRYRKWADYGGRGITVCDRWLRSFEAFLEDMGPRPSRLHTLDRRKNDRGYSKANCRWATWEEQASNRRSTRPDVTIDGVTRPFAEWTRILGVRYGLANTRVMRGWSPLEALLGKREKK